MEAPIVDSETGLQSSRERMTRLGKWFDAVGVSGILPLTVSHRASITTDVEDPNDRSKLTRMKGLATALEAAAIPAGIITGNPLVGLGVYGAGRILGTVTEVRSRNRIAP